MGTVLVRLTSIFRWRKETKLDIINITIQSQRQKKSREGINARVYARLDLKTTHNNVDHWL